MTAHATHHVHTNSAASLATLHDLGDRERRIVSALSILVIATDRQIAEWLNLTDMNAVRPRVSEMIKRGVLREVGSQACHVTGRTVRLIEVAS